MNIFTKFIDLIYPPRCHICRTFLDYANNGSRHFCIECLNSFSLVAPPVCSICGIPFGSKTQDDHLCERCLRKSPFYDLLRAPYLYKGTLMEVILQIKYSRKNYLADSLAPVFACFAEELFRNMEDLLLIPVPLHPQKLRERGFNQSLLLARGIEKKLNAELDFLSLRRVKYTGTQTGLNIDERRKNVRGAFDLVKGVQFKDRNVLLVDDVATTGSTMNECARVLKKAGCSRVYGLVLARTAAL